MKIIICILPLVAFLQSPLARGNGGFATGFGQSSNLFLDEHADKSNFFSVGGYLEDSDSFASGSLLSYRLDSQYRLYSANDKANRTALNFNSKYIRKMTENYEIHQTSKFIYHEEPNFLRQRLSHFTLYHAPGITKQTQARDFTITVPLRAHLFLQETQGRSNRADMFESKYKEDHYQAGIDLSWRFYLGHSFRESLQLGLASDSRFYIHKPATQKDGTITPLTNNSSSRKNRDAYTRLNLAYRFLGKHWEFEPSAEFGYNTDLNNGSEDHHKMVGTLSIQYSKRLFRINNLFALSHLGYRNKRADPHEPTQTKLKLNHYQNDLRSEYYLSENLNTVGGFLFERFTSAYSKDSYDLTELYAVISYTF